MTEAESYHFDVSGFLVVNGALSAAELDVLNTAIERTTDGGGDLPPAAAFRYPFLQLRDHPVLVAYVRSLCGDGYRLDNGPQLLGDKYASRYPGLASGFCTKGQRDAVEAFFKPEARRPSGTERNLGLTLEGIDRCIRLRAETESALDAYLGVRR